MPMTIDERRASLYAALLRFSPEAGSLRDRVLDRVVLAALLGTSEEDGLRVGAIKQNIQLGPDAPPLRTEVVQRALDRLIDEGFVDQAELKKRHAYFLTSDGVSRLNLASKTAADLFEPVLSGMLAGTSSICSEEQGSTACRRFISECFARFGQEIARMITGELSREEITAAVNVRAAFRSAIAGLDLSPEAVESLETRCVRFVKSTERHDEELKFHLTQGFFVAQLLGLDSAQFNPIADEAFNGSVFYLDTNVVIPPLISNEEEPFFDELIRIAERLGIELRVSRATIDEARTVAADRGEDLDAVVETVPPELVERARGEILDAFLAARQRDEDLTPFAFLQRFDFIPEWLTEVGIALDDRDVDAIIGKEDLSRECRVIDETAAATRGFGKSEAVRRHDASHLLLVRRERSEGKKAWFLTRDRTLAVAAVALANGDLPFCFPVVGLLQGLSPFVEAPSEHSSLVDLFSASLAGDFAGLPRESLFDLQELRLISELHTDVLSTPADELVVAFDYVKTTVLDGKPYREADHPKVALELRKFLTSTADEKHSALQAESRRQQEIAENERAKRAVAEKDAEHKASQLEAAEKRVDSSNAQLRSATRRERVLSVALAVMGTLLAAVVWRFEADLATSITASAALPAPFVPWIPLGVRVLAGMLVLGSALPPTRMLPEGYRVGALTVIAALVVGRMELLGPEQLSTWSGYLAIGAPVALGLAILLEPRLTRGLGRARD